MFGPEQDIHWASVPVEALAVHLLPNAQLLLLFVQL